MDRKISLSLLTTMSFATIVANASAASTGSIGFSGRVLAVTEPISVGPSGDVQGPRAAARVSPQRLADAKPAFNVTDANDLFDYFAGYAPASAMVVTVTYR